LPLAVLQAWSSSLQHDCGCSSPDGLVAASPEKNLGVHAHTHTPPVASFRPPPPLPQKQTQNQNQTTEITNTRVAWFSIFSLLVTVATGGFTVFHLRGFFKKRKLV
jgi:hypothetical protein